MSACERLEVTPLCQHCEARPQEHYLGLCGMCAKVKGIRVLYEKTLHLPPERLALIAYYRQRAAQQLPLFEPDVLPMPQPDA